MQFNFQLLKLEAIIECKYIYMRNSTIIGLGMALTMALPVGAETMSPLKVFKRACETQMAASHARKTPLADVAAAESWKVSETALKFKPTVTKTYGWNGRKWALDETITSSYDASGLPVSELSVDADGDHDITVFEYDGNGKVTFKETKVSSDGVNFENYKKSEFEYDPILTDVITRRTEWLWMDLGNGKDWQPVGNNYKRIITRNEDGCITSVVIAVLFEGIYDPTQRLTVTYGEDGKAIAISEEILDYDYGTQEYIWEQGILITDVRWETTDGQIYDPENLFLGNNRIKSAHYEDEDDMSFDVSVEYAADSEAYTMTMKGIMIDEDMGDYEIEGIAKYTPLENDGYMAESTTTLMGEEMTRSKEEVRYDDWGHLTLEYYEEEEDGGFYYEKTVGDVEYDSEGRPSSYTVSVEDFDSNDGKVESEMAFRAEYFDYIDVTAGVCSAAEADGPVKYYNLQGMEVKHPAEGMILIRHQGEKVEKIKY